MIGDYHSVTCWSDECDGWYCDCPCHDDEPAASTGLFTGNDDDCGEPTIVSDPSRLIEGGAEQDCHPYPAPNLTDSPERLP